MKNLMMYIAEKGGDGLESVKRNLELQVVNSLDLGWRTEDMLLFTNFPFAVEGVRSIEVVPAKRPPKAHGNAFHKTHCLLMAFDRIAEDEIVWYHDTDAYQLIPIEAPPGSWIFAACLYCVHKRLMIQNGSMFFTGAAKPIWENAYDLLVHHRYRLDELALTDLMSRPEHIGNYVQLDYSYNLGTTDFELRYQFAQKPIKVVHFHVERPEHGVQFFQAENSLGVAPLPERFVRLAHRFGYGAPAAPARRWWSR
jgi:hypothetical protein